ncbi:hypothetical protein [Qipengyuania sphaerica]|uniref:hypothetical protein n=1 Tax=Qipengyuania sphaerica TaxID=2867243 RepID=UPI001C86D146|nr:hypothetical protein [Qipengyuania sphaerica]MBX7540996.1 hypothetical protein [Qipengyuania sphaerica]
MSQASATRADTLWAVAAVVPFLLSIALLAYTLAQQVAFAFAIAWPVLQVIGYWGSLKRSGGAVNHPLVITQVVLHWLVLVLLIALWMRVS